VNRLLPADFDPETFTHVARYDDDNGRIEMHLEANKRHVVRLNGATRTFETGERIHTENSYKYSPAEFTATLQDAGFARVRCWQDPARDFAVFYAA
jgi:uncharacterized SAM-dependent methyltransferase